MDVTQHVMQVYLQQLLLAMLKLQITSICCGFDVQLAVQQIYNKSKYVMKFEHYSVLSSIRRICKGWTSCLARSKQYQTT